MKSNSIKVILGYYLVFISYWLLKFEVLDYYLDVTIAKIIAYIYLYFIATPLFRFIIGKNYIYEKKDVHMRWKTYINILIVQSGLSIGILQLIGIIERNDIGNANNTIDAVEVFILLLFAPVFEELLYRRIILNVLKMSNIKAVFVSAFLFASVHIVSQGFKQMCYTMVLGIIWGYLAVMGVGIKKLIFFHSFSNLWGYILPIALANYLPQIAKIFNIVSGAIIPVFALILWGCFMDKMKKDYCYKTNNRKI